MARRTDQGVVLRFLEHLVANAPVPAKDMVVVCDNHASHHSIAVRQWADQQELQIVFLPPYSSTLNPVEKVWHSFKAEWAKQLAQLRLPFDFRQFELRMEMALGIVHRRLNYSIMHSADRYRQLSLNGHLV